MSTQSSVNQEKTIGQYVVSLSRRPYNKQCHDNISGYDLILHRRSEINRERTGRGRIMIIIGWEREATREWEEIRRKKMEHG